MHSVWKVILQDDQQTNVKPNTTHGVYVDLQVS